MKKQILQLGVILVLLAGLNFPGSSQTRKYPDLTVTIASGGTDYKVTFDYSSVASVNCEYYRTHIINFYRDGDDDDDIFATSQEDGKLSSAHFEFGVGPNSVHKYGLRYKEYSHSVYSCNEYAWSGFKRDTYGNWAPDPATSVEDRDYWFNLGRYSVNISANTVPIKSPGSRTVSNEEYFDKIVLNWTKGSDIPDQSVQIMSSPHNVNLYYKIYKGTTASNMALVTTLAADARSWTDNTIVPNDEYYYCVTTYTNGWGGHESPHTSGYAMLGKAKKYSVDASDSLYTGRVKVSWADLSSFADEIRIERSIPNSTGREELAILSKNAMAYNDADAIPGYRYTYYVTPIKSGRTFPTLSDTGYRKPNGTISGYVKSLLNAGVSGVQVCAKLVGTIPAGANAVPAGGYCATTDMDGYFEIRNIYYYSEAKFSIVPYKSGGGIPHIFTPDTIKRMLDLNSKTSSGANFTDQSVFTVGGQVIFPISSTGVTCGVPKVEIKLNGQSRGIITNAEGRWTFALQDEGEYTFKPVFLHHRFENSQGQQETKLFINGDQTSIDFTDKQTDSIMVKVQGGCGDPVAKNYATIRVTSPGNCFNETHNTDANGIYILRNMPACKYDIKVETMDPYDSNVMAQIGDKTIQVDLTVRDTADVISTRKITEITPADTITLPNDSIVITPADTTITTVTDTTRSEVIPAADFIYHSPLKITVDFEDAGAELPGCKNAEGNDIILMEQNMSYPLVFEVMEELGDCRVKEGVLRIFDFVSDKGDLPVEIPIDNGSATYVATAGLPEIAESAAHNHEKLIYVLPKVGFLDAKPEEYWITVTGVLNQAPSFITRSPDLPLLILHDPPGDKSTASVEKGTEFRSFQTTEMRVGGELGAYANLLIGAKVLTPFSSNAAGMILNIKAEAGTDEYWRDGMETTITFNEKFTTSDMDVLAGNTGDVYIGASFNQEFALGDELSFDKDECKVNLKVVPTIDITGFATTFIYTEKHIVSTLLPTLGVLRAAVIAGRDSSQLSEEDKILSNQLLYDSLHWESVIAKNMANRDSNAVFKKNISFSAGAPYSSEYSSESKTSESFEYNAYVNTEFAIGAKIDNEAGIWYDSELGVTAKVRWSTKGESGTSGSTKLTVGYTLDDDDMGDFFSVDVKEDTAYGVPAFDLVLGTTSCPPEEGSQPRDDARIQIYPPQINNVPIDGKAVFTANLLNQSQSRETREYSVQVVSTSNPDGAVVKLAGEPINFRPASFWIDFNQTNSIALTVEKGPLATNYDSIGIMMFPSCEMDQWDEGGDILSGDTAWIFVDFQSECSNVALHLPGNGWLVNHNNNNILHIAFTGYDVNNEKLESITLQYKKEGQGWIDDVTVMKNELTGFFYDYDFDVSGLSDGAYRLRAKAYCGNEGGFSYSSEQSGIIDRSSMAPFGMPSPADGYLRLGQEISVTFDKDINCNFGSYPASSQAIIKLFREDSTEIPITVQCSENQDKLILVPDNNLFLQPDLEGVRLFAMVKDVRDVSGNVQKYPTQWSFLVNVSPVSWNPDTVFLSAEETEEVIISANLDNSAVISKAFTISQWPAWMMPSVTSASILPENSFTVQFRAVENLKPGLYTGQVIVSVDNVPEILTVTLELYAKAIDWKINQHDFEYSMNVVAQFSADQGDLNLSTCTRDKIAATINGDLRGVGNISFVPELNKYAAFINVFSNQAGSNGSFLEAENWESFKGANKIKNISDEGLNATVVRIKKDQWIEFDIYATKDGNHTVEFRVASIKPFTGAQLLVDGVLKTTMNLPNTGNLTTFTTVSTTVSITKGTHSFRIYSIDAEFDLNWFNFPEYHVRNQYSEQIIKFRMWDGINGIEYGAVEELTFFSDGVVGRADTPFLLHPAGGIQDVLLSKGWNWISVNKANPDMGLGKIFESITPPTSLNNLTLKSQTAFSQFSQASGWQGNLTTIDPRLGYMIHLSSHPDTLSMIGSTPGGNMLLTLNPKWNWIGYPKPGIKGVSEVLDTLDAISGDLLKSQFAFAEFNASAGTWIGDLDFFEPGKGYKLFLSGGGILDMLKSTSSGNLNKKYEFNMTLTAAVLLGGVPVSEDLYLQTYIDEQLRGVVPLTHVEALDKNMAFAMIYGERADIGERVEVILWDNKLQKNIMLSGEEINFNIDQIKGTILNPVMLSAVNPGTSATDIYEAGHFAIYPNPFSERTYIRYSVTGTSHVSLTITNSLGAEVTRIVDLMQPAGNYQYIFEPKGLPTGMYYCTLKTDKFVETKKILLLDNK